MSQHDKVYEVSESQISQFKMHIADAKEGLKGLPACTKEEQANHNKTASMLRMIGTLVEGIEEFPKNEG